MLSKTVRAFLISSMLVSLSFSSSILLLGLYLYLYFHTAVVNLLDGFIKNLNTTKFVILYHESLVPSQDDLPEEIDLGSWPHVTSYGLIVLGLSMMLLSIFGLVVSVYRSFWGLWLFAALLAFELCFQFVLMDSVLNSNSHLNMIVRGKLTTALQDRFDYGIRSSNGFTFVMNSAMLLGECCGIQGPTDFMERATSNVSFSLKNKQTQVPVIFPLACCKRSFIQRGFQDTLSCASSGDMANINNLGCYAAIHNYFTGQYGALMIAVLALLLAWQVLQIMAAISLTFATSEQDRSSTQSREKAVHIPCQDGHIFRGPNSTVELSYTWTYNQTKLTAVFSQPYYLPRGLD